MCAWSRPHPGTRNEDSLSDEDVKVERLGQLKCVEFAAITAHRVHIDFDATHETGRWTLYVNNVRRAEFVLEGDKGSASIDVTKFL